MKAEFASLLAWIVCLELRIHGLSKVQKTLVVCMCACVCICCVCAHVWACSSQRQENQGYLPLSVAVEPNLGWGAERSLTVCVKKKKKNCPVSRKFSPSLFSASFGGFKSVL